MFTNQLAGCLAHGKCSINVSFMTMTVGHYAIFFDGLIKILTQVS